MKYIKGFDTLRGLATFCVVMNHFGLWFDTSAGVRKFIKDVLVPDGRLCVYFFFVLSGFLITSILLRAKDSAGNNSKWHTLWSYIIRRALRIYPVYYLLLTILFITNFPDVRQNIVYFATYTSNLLIYRTGTWNAFCVTWTLSIEEQFYLLWPLVILFVQDKYLKWIMAAAVAIGIITTYFTVAVQQHIAPCLVCNCFDAFGIGGLYAWIKIRNYRCAAFERSVKMIVCVAIAFYFYWKISWFLGRNNPYFFMEKTTYSCIGLWLIIWVANNRSVWLRNWFFENRILNFTGKIGYGIYLFHDVYINGWAIHVNNLLNRLTIHHPSLNTRLLSHHCNYWIHITIIFVVAAASYLLFEKPILHLKTLFVYNKPSPDPTGRSASSSISSKISAIHRFFINATAIKK